MYTVAAAFNGAETGGGMGGIFTAIMPLILIFMIFYFLLILPQRKKEKEHIKMVKSLKRGDRIITTGGIYGTITRLKKNYVEVEVSDKTKLRIQRNCILQLRREE